MPRVEPGSLSQWALIRRRFEQHRLAVMSLYLLAVLYVMAIGAEFFAPYPRQWRDHSHAYCPPQLPRFSLAHGFYVPAMQSQQDPLTLKKTYHEDEARVVALGFFAKGAPYRFIGLFASSRHFFGVKDTAARRPELLIADEPTTALDVTIQAQILGLIKKLQREIGCAVLLITHDFGVVAQMADDVAVMQQGQIVERGPVRDVLKNPQHAHTRLLLSAVPSPDPDVRMNFNVGDELAKLDTAPA